MQQEKNAEEEQEQLELASSENNTEDTPPAPRTGVTPGQMSVEEAEQLLNEMKNEEGNLNFLPAGPKNPERMGRKNW